MKESILYYLIRIFGFLIRLLPTALALGLGRVIGMAAYYFNQRHKVRAYANLRKAFAQTKSPEEIKAITKNLFKNFGQNFIEVFRLPLLNQAKFEHWVKIEGKENVDAALKQGKGAILLAMHFGSWELASLSCAMLGYPYKVIVKPQKKYTKLDNLLNSYRTCGGSVVLSRGFDTREFIKSLKNNEVIGMVVDQGGKDGVLVPFFGHGASMSVGAIRMGLKMGVPLCFSIIVREKGSQHRMMIQKPLELEHTGNAEHDIEINLRKVTKIMEQYIEQYPAEYMWFYKIWKYSKESNIGILDDGKLGHLRQSQAVAETIQTALGERNIRAEVKTITITFKSKFREDFFSLICFLTHPFFYQGRLDILKWFLTEDSVKQVVSFQNDFIVSCGASLATMNYFLAKEQNAKSIAILKPGILGLNKFDLTVLPQHDVVAGNTDHARIAVTYGAPNLIDDHYLSEQRQLLLERFTHLKTKQRLTIGLLIGGEAKHVFLSESQIKLLIHQLKEVAEEINANILITTSRRTPEKIEQLLQREFKKDPRCPLLIVANRHNIPEAVGGILGLSDILVVSGDSISMISEAASSGKHTIVFPAQDKHEFFRRSNKFKIFIDHLNAHGYICSSDVRGLGRTIYDIAKNKRQTKRLDNQQIILEAVRKII